MPSLARSIDWACQDVQRRHARPVGRPNRPGRAQQHQRPRQRPGHLLRDRRRKLRPRLRLRKLRSNRPSCLRASLRPCSPCAIACANGRSATPPLQTSASAAARQRLVKPIVKRMLTWPISPARSASAGPVPMPRLLWTRLPQHADSISRTLWSGDPHPPLDQKRPPLGAAVVFFTGKPGSHR